MISQGTGFGPRELTCPSHGQQSRNVTARAAVSDQGPDASGEKRVPNSVLGRTLLLLDCFVQTDQQLNLTELSRRSGIAKGTAHRMLCQLVQLGVLEKAHLGYRIGTRLFELGQLTSRPGTLRDACLPNLLDLAEATGETVHLAVFQGNEVLYLEKLRRRTGPDLPSRVGGRMPAHCTALGKAILAFAPNSVVQSVLDGGLPRRTARTIIMPGLLMRELSAVRRTGIAYEHEESTPGVRCVASPVMNGSKVPIAAISVAGWTHRLELSRVSSAVRTASLALSRELASVLPTEAMEPSEYEKSYERHSPPAFRSAEDLLGSASVLPYHGPDISS